MGLNLNPKIVTNGLVFAYDMGNKYKSFKGAPTTNLASFDVAASGFSTDTPANITQTGNSSERMYQGRLSRKIVINAAGYWNTYIYNYNTGVSSTVFAGSCKVKTLDGLHPNTFMSGGYLYGSAGVTYPGLTFTLEDDGWYRVTWLYNGASMTLNSLTGLQGTAPSSKTFYITDYQVEALSFSTPFAGVSGASRSNTQSLLDQTNNSTPTATSLTYSSDGTFSFNGSSDTMDCGNPSALSAIAGTSAVSVEAWVNLSGYGSSSYGVITHKGYPWTWLMENPSNTMKIRFYLSNSGDVSCSDSATHALNTWYHFTGTYDGSYMRFYRNGVLTNSVAGSGTLGGASSNMVIGSYSGAYYSQGQIPVIKIYNKTLTDQEIRQNFNALRGRYGI